MLKLSIITWDPGFRESFHTIESFQNIVNPGQESWDFTWVNGGENANPLLSRLIERSNNFKLLNFSDEDTWHVGRMLNAGAKSTNGDWLLFIDGDILVSEDFILKCQELMTQGSNIVYYGRRIDEKPENHTTSFRWNWEAISKFGSPQPEYNCGACLLVSRSLFERVKGYEEHSAFRGAGAISRELNARIINTGTPISWHKELRVYHPWHPGTLPKIDEKQRIQQFIIDRKIQNTSLRADKNETESFLSDYHGLNTKRRYPRFVRNLASSFHKFNVARKYSSNTSIFKKPIFILSAPRSGSSYLHSGMLLGNGIIGCKQETDIAWWNTFSPIRKNLLSPSDFISPEEATHEQRGKLKAELLRLLRSEGIRTNKLTRGRYLEKTIANTLRSKALLNLFPQASLLLLTRDPWDVICSMRMGWLEKSFTRPYAKLTTGLNWNFPVPPIDQQPSTIEDACISSLECFTAVLLKLSTQNRNLLIKYEELISCPDLIFTKINAHLQIKQEKELTEYIRKSPRSYSSTSDPSKHKWENDYQYFKPFADRINVLCEQFGYKTRFQNDTTRNRSNSIAATEIIDS